MQVESQHEDGQDHRGHDLQRDHGDHVWAEEEEAERSERAVRSGERNPSEARRKGQSVNILTILPQFR